MNLALFAGAAALSCCIAANAASVTGLAPAASAPSGAAAASGTDSGFAPSAEAAVLDAVKRNGHETPACRTDRADAIVDGRIHVRAGETLCVALRVDGNRASAVGLVNGAASRDALVVTARQDDGRTFLTLVNPLRGWLRYRAWMLRSDSDGFIYTSSCPVMSDHRVGFEDWPFTIDELALGDFTLEPATGGKEQVECR